MLNLIPVFLSEKSVQARIDELIKFITDAPENSLILASELCISGYDFDGLFADTNATMLGGAVGGFDAILMQRLQDALMPNKFLGFTHLASKNDSLGLAKISITNAKEPTIYNEFALLNSQNVFYTQNKSHLFTPNDERKFFSAGDEGEVSLFKFAGLNLGVLICFELRFCEFWARLKGADVVLVPSMWGAAREDAYLSLCKALAIANNCYVMASSSLDLNFAGVFLPNGELKQSVKFDPGLIREIKLNLGILD